MIALPILIAATIAAQSGPDLVDFQQVRIQEYKKIQAIRDRIRNDDPKAGEIPPSLIADPAIRKMGIQPEDNQLLLTALAYKFEHDNLANYRPLDWSSKDPVLNYTTARFDAKGEPKFMTVKAALQDQQLAIYRIRITATPVPTAGQPAKDPQIAEEYFGPFLHDDAVNEMHDYERRASQAQPVKVKTEIIEGATVPVELWDNDKGDVAVVFPQAPPSQLIFQGDPHLVIFNSTPSAVTEAYNNRGKTVMPPLARTEIGVKDGDQLVDFVHLKHQMYLSLQQVRDKVAAQHPTEGDFPAEFLQTPEFKATGIVLPRDQETLIGALAYRPENYVLKGFHPIDWDKDKAAQYTTVTTGQGGRNIALSLKEAYAQSAPLMMKVKVTPTALNMGKATELYFGPVRPDYASNLKSKPGQNVKIEELTQQNIPLQVYTNAQGAVAFVYASTPANALMLPIMPMTPLWLEPIDKVQAVLDAHDSDRGSQLRRADFVTFAVLKS